MTPHIEARRMPLIGALIAFVFVLGCHEIKNPTMPATNAPPIEIRADAASYGTAGGLKVESAVILGRTLQLKVSYSGGCKEHTFAAAAAPQFLESFPAQLGVFIRHEPKDDMCLAINTETLTFDVTPAVRLHQQLYGSPGPFYLNIIVPGETEHLQVLVPSDPHS
jgi:hypothetical protein